MAGRTRISVSLLATLVTAALIAAPAADARGPIGASGVIHACYKAKGKHKGAVRLVKSASKCKRKKRERAVTWAVKGEQGPAGAQGEQGPAGSSSDVSELLSRVETLETEVAALTDDLATLQNIVDGLSDVLSGLTSTELTDAVTNAAKLEGINGTDLETAVSGFPGLASALESTCTALADQSNAMGDTVDAMLAASLPVLDTSLGALTGTTAPADLVSADCPL